MRASRIFYTGLLTLIIFTLALSLFPRDVKAQPEEEWSRTYGGDDNEEASSVVLTSDGGYALTGVTMSFGAGQSDFWLIKTDNMGGVG